MALWRGGTMARWHYGPVPWTFHSQVAALHPVASDKITAILAARGGVPELVNDFDALQVRWNVRSSGRWNV